MIIAIWDWLFTRRVWKIIEIYPVQGYDYKEGDAHTAMVYVMQDQFGNIKTKRVSSGALK